ncbi:hypothetical protein Tco_0405531 [Tanacetum coccineum]
MTTNHRRSRRRVKILIKYGDTICSLNNKMNDQSIESNVQLENGQVMGDNKEIGEIRERARVSDFEKVELNSDNLETEGLRCNLEKEIGVQDTCDDNQNTQEYYSSNVGLNKLNDDKHLCDRNDEQKSNNKNVNDETSKEAGVRDVEPNSYIEKLLNNKDNRDNKLCHVPTVINESGQEFVIFDDEIVNEANATKGLVDFVEVLYLNKQNGEQYVKKVKVEYDWKPQVCTQCLVFRHSDVNCPKKEKEVRKNQEVNEAHDGFVNEKSKKSNDNEIKSIDTGIGRNMQQNNQMRPFQKKEVVNKKIWKVGENVINDVRDTANKFSVLQEIEEEYIMMKLNLREMNMVKRFVKEKIQPSINESKDWTKEMIGYFKECWKEHYDKNKEVEDEGTDIELDENDVYIEKNGIAKFMTENEVRALVEEKWKMEVQGHAMFKMEKKLRALKSYLNKLNWKHGNLFDRVATLKEKLHVIQAKIDRDPSNKNLRLEGV